VSAGSGWPAALSSEREGDETGEGKAGEAATREKKGLAI